MAKKKWLVDFDVLVSCTMAVEAESEDDARRHVFRETRLTPGSFCEEYSHSMEVQEDTIEVNPDYIDDEKQ